MANENSTLQGRDKDAYDYDPSIGWQRKSKITNSSSDSVPVTSTDISANITINNENIASANTEQSLTLESNVTQLLIRNRDLTAETKISFVSGESGTKYISIRKGSVLNLNGFKLANAILYFQSNKTSVIEIIQWH